MRHYEMMLILRDDLDEEAVAQQVERIQSTITDSSGQVIQTEHWGRRPFAYEIDHRRSGYYVVLDLEAEADAVGELERQLKINDDVVRFKTIRPEVRVHKPGDPRRRTPV
ncbi:MAG: 30S ribosomal protein S6 [Actinomycetota bacterium]|nr:30S ribosomal protein S6 [Actinomycetota bacterium]